MWACGGIQLGGSYVRERVPATKCDWGNFKCDFLLENAIYGIFRLLIKSRGFVDKESDSVDKESGKCVDKETLIKRR